MRCVILECNGGDYTSEQAEERTTREALFEVESIQRIRLSGYVWLPLSSITLGDTSIHPRSDGDVERRTPSNNILRKPEHILSFIKHALQNDTMQEAAHKQTSRGPTQG